MRSFCSDMFVTIFQTSRATSSPHFSFIAVFNDDRKLRSAVQRSVSSFSCSYRNPRFEASFC